MTIHIANLRDMQLPLGEREVYVGRKNKWRGMEASVLANAFVIGSQGRGRRRLGLPPISRAESVRLYRQWLRVLNGANPGVSVEIEHLRALASTGDLTLVCWCMSDLTGEVVGKQPCHAQIIRDALLAGDLVRWAEGVG